MIWLKRHVVVITIVLGVLGVAVPFLTRPVIELAFPPEEPLPVPIVKLDDAPPVSDPSLLADPLGTVAHRPSAESVPATLPELVSLRICGGTMNEPYPRTLVVEGPTPGERYTVDALGWVHVPRAWDVITIIDPLTGTVLHHRKLAFLHQPMTIVLPVPET